MRKLIFVTVALLVSFVSQAITVEEAFKKISILPGVTVEDISSTVVQRQFRKCSATNLISGRCWVWLRIFASRRFIRRWNSRYQESHYSADNFTDGSKK